MRVLVAFVGGAGHLEPQLPFARALAVAGHEVAVTGRPSMTVAMERTGFEWFASGSNGVDPTTMQPLLELDQAREDAVLRHGFAGRAAAERADAIIALATRWGADLVMCDEVDFGAMIAAEVLGVPCVLVIVSVEGSFVRPVLVADPLNELRQRHRLERVDDPTLPAGAMLLSTVPPSFRNPTFPWPPRSYSFRFPTDSGSAESPWHRSTTDRPLISFSLGTVFNMESGDLFDRVLAGLAQMPIDVVATVGRQLDPARFAGRGDNIRVERFVALGELLPHCVLSISHGGSGSVIGALAHAVPMVLIPMGADQPLNARRCAELGVACVIDAVRSTPADVAAAVTAALADSAAYEAARRLSDEMAALPDVSAAVPMIESLVTQR